MMRRIEEREEAESLVECFGRVVDGVHGDGMDADGFPKFETLPDCVSEEVTSDSSALFSSVHREAGE